MKKALGRLFVWIWLIAFALFVSYIVHTNMGDAETNVKRRIDLIKK